MGPPASKKVLLLGNYWWYNYDFGQSYNYSGWGDTQQMGISPETLSMRNVVTKENEAKEVTQLYLGSESDQSKVFSINVSPCSYSQVSFNLLEE